MPGLVKVKKDFDGSHFPPRSLAAFGDPSVDVLTFSGQTPSAKNYFDRKNPILGGPHEDSSTVCPCLRRSIRLGASRYYYLVEVNVSQKDDLLSGESLLLSPR